MKYNVDLGDIFSYEVDAIVIPANCRPCERGGLDKIAYKKPKIILKFTSKRIKEMYFETEKEAKDMYEMLIAMFNNKCLTFNPEYD